MQVFEVNGQRVLIANIDGIFYVLNDKCPHREALRHEGWLQGNVIECSWYHYRYDVRRQVKVSTHAMSTPLTSHIWKKDLKPVQSYPVWWKEMRCL